MFKYLQLEYERIKCGMYMSGHDFAKKTLHCKSSLLFERTVYLVGIKLVTLCYGASGHGRGLVDAMSSFVLKGPVRKEIITSVFYWSSAKDLEIKFNEMDMGENRSCSIEIQYKKVDLCDCEACVIDKLSYCIYEESGNANATANHGNGENEGADDNDQGDDDGEIESDEEEQRKLTRNNIWNAVVPGAVITLWTPTDAKESF